MSQALQAHTYSNVVPPMSGEEYHALKADIALNGLHQPIVLYEGKILDGRHRYLACTELGIKPTFREWAGPGLAIDYVLSENLHRRHLDKSQRAAIAVEAQALREAERKARERQQEGRRKGGRTGGRGRQQDDSFQERIPESKPTPRPRDEVAQQFGTNPRYIQDAKAIRDRSPALLKQVAEGQMTLPQAKQQLRRQEKQQELKRKARQAGKAADCWEIRQGDCLAVLPALSHKARLVFADPPYNIGIDYGEGGKADRLPDDEYLAWVEQWLAACCDVLTSDGSLWVLIGDEYAAEYAVTLKRLGLFVRSWIKWYETFGVNCTRNFNRCSRHLFYCVRNVKQFVFHEEPVTRPSDRQTKYADRRADPGGKLWDNVWQIPRLTGTSSERLPDFPTQLPLALLEPIVQCASDPGDLVIDPFSGSGTTGVAAVRHGRRFLGIERSQHFVELSRLRLEGVDHA